MSRGRKGSQGHPARLTRDRKRQARRNPTPRDREINELVRLVRREANVSGQEGPLVGPLAAAAKHAAPIVAGHYGLHGEEHELAVANYLTEQLGEVIDSFDPIAYRDWRLACVAEEV